MITTAQLRGVAIQAMREHGMAPDFTAAILDEANKAAEPDFAKLGIRDLSAWLWSSIDNDESRDLDQIEYAAKDPAGTRIYVAIADVSLFVANNSELDLHARQNTTSVYTGVQTFSMLPERLSTDLSSLNENQKRAAIVMEMLVDAKGVVTSSDLYPAIVLNKAQLTYPAVALWLRQKLTLPGANEPISAISTQRLEKIKTNPELQAQLLLQHQTAELLRTVRHAAGALSLQTAELQPTMTENGPIDLNAKLPNEATQLIEDFMIAANQATDEFLRRHNTPVLQRVVRVPKRWDRIVELAASRGTVLPADPNAPALEAFLAKEHTRDPERFADLSLSIVKLLGRGEYIVSTPGQVPLGHFGLAVQHYSHSTAPNRRYPDLLTQRLLHSVFSKTPLPYTVDELTVLALRCTTQEDEANKVERLVRKCVAAAALTPHIGQSYDGFITGASDKGTFVRLKSPPVEGKVVHLTKKLDVGDPVHVKLISTDPLRGYIDFAVQ